MLHNYQWSSESVVKLQVTTCPLEPFIKLLDCVFDESWGRETNVLTEWSSVKTLHEEKWIKPHISYNNVCVFGLNKHQEISGEIVWMVSDSFHPLFSGKYLWNPSLDLQCVKFWLPKIHPYSLLSTAPRASGSSSWKALVRHRAAYCTTNVHLDTTLRAFSTVDLAESYFPHFQFFFHAKQSSLHPVSF